MMKNLLILQSLIGTRYMIAIFAMEHQFNFLLFHLLVHTKLNIFHFLEMQICYYIIFAGAFQLRVDANFMHCVVCNSK